MPQGATARECLEQRWRQALLFLALALLAFWMLRGCIPGLSGRGGMPTGLYNRIASQYVTCVDQYAIRPGDRRQPDCGTVTIEVAGKGAVPPGEEAAGVEKALCYQATYTNPYIETMGSAVTHDEFWKSRTARKVTVYQDGAWQIFPDQDREDERRWIEYGCPGAY